MSKTVYFDRYNQYDFLRSDPTTEAEDRTIEKILNEYVHRGEQLLRVRFEDDGSTSFRTIPDSDVEACLSCGNEAYPNCKAGCKLFN